MLLTINIVKIVVFFQFFTLYDQFIISPFVFLFFSCFVILLYPPVNEFSIPFLVWFGFFVLMAYQLFLGYLMPNPFY